jgi:hypothetical protein
MISMAQHRAVKDNIACAYGIKNEAGEWIVEPSYQLIRGYQNGFFVTHDGVNYGVLDFNGKEIIPCEYDQIRDLGRSMQLVNVGMSITKGWDSPENPTLIEAITKGERTLFKMTGEQIAPMRAQSFKRDGKNLIVSEYFAENGSFVSYYMDLNGTVLFDAIAGVPMPFDSRTYTLVGGTYGRGERTMRINVYLIDKQGKKVLPNVFSSARICRDNMIVYSDDQGRIGAMDISGESLIEPEFIFDSRTIGYNQDLPCFFGSEQQFIISDNSMRYGIMDGAGTVLCEPGYERLETAYGWMKTDAVTWRTYIRDKEGILSKNGKVTIPCVYDTLIPFAYNRISPRKRGGFIAKKNGVYGILDSSGDTLLPIEFGFFNLNRKDGNMMFGKKGAISFVSTLSDSLKLESIDPFFENEELTLFRTKEGQLKAIGPNIAGELVPLQINESWNTVQIYTPKQLYIFTKNGELLNLDTPISAEAGSRFLVVTTSDKKQYLIDRKKGAIILGQDAFLDYNVNSSTHDYLWAKGYGEGEKWMIIDSAGNQVSGITFDEPFRLNSKITFTKNDGYWGLFNIDEMKWAMEPEYQCISVVKEGMYRAQNQEGLWSIVRLDSADLIVGAENIEPLWSTNFYKLDCLFRVNYTGKPAFIIDAEGNKTVGAEAVYAKMKHLAYLSPNEGYATSFQFANVAFSSQWMTKSSMPPIGIPRVSEEFLASPMSDLLYDSMLLFNGVNNVSNSGIVVGLKNDKCDCFVPTRSDLTFDLNFATPYAASVAISRFSKGYSWDMGENVLQRWVNLVYENNEIRPITLLEIYQNNQQLLYDHFIATLQENENIVLECSTVENMLERTGNRFLLTGKGIQLFIRQNNGRDIKLVIPWSRLAGNEQTNKFVEKLAFPD